MEPDTRLLDSFVVELRISSGHSFEMQRAILAQLDASGFARRLRSRIQAALNSEKLDQILASIRR